MIYAALLSLAMTAAGNAQAPSDVVDSLPVPRSVAPLPVDDQAAVETLLVSLIEQEEGLTANVPNAPEDKDLEVQFTPDQAPCQLSADGAQLVCEVNYERGRWNGVLDATLTVDGGKATELTKADFTGNF